MSALADPPRRQIIAHLAGGEATVLEPVDLFDLTQPTVSAHIKVLERAGLIVRRGLRRRGPAA
ncbi:MAG: ArsR/SmtB family transcription factor [Gemmobacter sp.]